MSRDTRYDILFEPIKIGPKIAKNRFYQVPHCNGMGHASPLAHAAMRGMKAEGGWAVVSTEEVEIHPTGDITPYIEGRLWDDRDIPYHRLMTDAVHAHGALAAIELVHNGPSCANLNTREVPIGPSAMPVFWTTPLQARAMDKEDISAYRQWHRDAVRRSLASGFDVVYVYAGHNLSLPMHFLSRRRNHRSDEYGGSLENRVRLLREVLEDTRELVDGKAALALRFAVDELAGPLGIEASNEGKDVVEILADFPDLWDVNVADWDNDSQTSRFAGEGYQEPYTAFVKRVTDRPVVGVGRFTSPDTMVDQIRRGVLDFIGAARPSIADPFLPSKIERGEAERVRECIGCNICVSGDLTISPIRCTQNPAMGEEWRRGWHPERAPTLATPKTTLIVGAGPAGLECARVLALRGERVFVAEASRTLGGRVPLEAALPGLGVWKRVTDYRIQELERAGVDIFRESVMSLETVAEFAADRIVVATGCHWRRDGVGRSQFETLKGLDSGLRVFTPDDLMSGTKLPLPGSRVVIYDDDHYYLGGVLAEFLVRRGHDVALATPEHSVSSWTGHTLEHGRIQARMRQLGVEVRSSYRLIECTAGGVVLADVYAPTSTRTVDADALVLVTARLPNDLLARELEKSPLARRTTTIGDAHAPGTIAHAVWSGFRHGIDLDRESPLAMKRHVHGESFAESDGASF